MIPGTDFTPQMMLRHHLQRSALSLLAVAAVVATLLSSAQHPASAQGFPTEISGRVVQGTEGAEVRAGLEVLLLVVDEAQQSVVGTDSKIVGTNGEFTFTDFLSGPGLTYRVVANDDLYTPSIDLRPGEDSFDNVELTIYEQTQSFDDIRVSTYQLLIPSIDGGERLMGILGVISLTNSGDRVWVPDLDNPQLTGLDLLRFNLPEGFQDLSVETTLPPGGNILDISTGFALTNPVPPGEHDILMTFVVEYEGDNLSFPLRLAYGADQVRLMLPEGEGTITGLGLSDPEGAIVEDTAYSVVTGTGYERGSQLDVEFSSLPTPSLLERTQNFFDGRGYISVIALVAGAAMLVLLIYAFFLARARRLSQETATADQYPEYDGLTRAEIVETIAKLDSQHEAGEIEEAEYNSRRSALTKAALSAGKSEDGPE